MCARVGATLKVYVDDITIEVEGSKTKVAEVLKNASRLLNDGINKVGLTLSATKSVVLATCGAVADFVARTSVFKGERMLKRKHSAKMLGCGTAGGNRRRGRNGGIAG